MIQIAKRLTNLPTKILCCHDNSLTKKRKVTMEEDSLL